MVSSFICSLFQLIIFKTEKDVAQSLADYAVITTETDGNIGESTDKLQKASQGCHRNFSKKLNQQIF